MSVEERLSEECKRIGLNQTEFDPYKAGESSLNIDYWKAVALAGVNVQYILTGQTRHDQLSVKTVSVSAIILLINKIRC